MFDVQWVMLRLKRLRDRSLSTWGFCVNDSGQWYLTRDGVPFGPTPYESASDLCDGLEALMGVGNLVPATRP